MYLLPLLCKVEIFGTFFERMSE